MAIAGNGSIWFGAIFPYMVMEGNEGILFSTIIPYMVMAGNEGILLSVIINTLDVTVLLELVLYWSSI